MKEEMTITSIDELPSVADWFVGLMGDYTVFAFNGDMGVGKTTFIRQLCARLGVDEDMANSPSFAIVNEYRSDTTAELIYHFDLYRLNDAGEALDIGIEDYFDSGAICLLEWPGVVDALLPDDTVRVDIVELPNGDRRFRIDIPE